MKLILLVEDSRFLRMATAKVLEKAGYSVVTASDGEEALTVAAATPPDLILLDMLLPRLSGIEVLRALRKGPMTSRTPIVVLSGLAQKNEIKLKAEGATAYFEKSGLELNKGLDCLIEMVAKNINGAETQV
jgi:CheY-like chemotaxis protein